MIASFDRTETEPPRNTGYETTTCSNATSETVVWFVFDSCSSWGDGDCYLPPPPPPEPIHIKFLKKRENDKKFIFQKPVNLKHVPIRKIHNMFGRVFTT